jgi:hypothetical protein
MKTGISEYSPQSFLPEGGDDLTLQPAVNSALKRTTRSAQILHEHFILFQGKKLHNRE